MMTAMNAPRRAPSSWGHRRHAYKTCAFTGHRPEKLPFGLNEDDPRCVDFKRRVRETLEGLIGEGYALFVSGGAMGFDTFAAEAVLELKARYPWVMLEMVSPYDGQADRWPDAWKARHARLLRAADIVTATGRAYERGCLFRRNRYLVNRADLLLAAFDGQSGGTAMTVGYAREKGVAVREIRP